MANFFCFGSFLDKSTATEQNPIEPEVDEKEVDKVEPNEEEAKVDEGKDSDEAGSIQHILRDNLLMDSTFTFGSYFRHLRMKQK